MNNADSLQYAYQEKFQQLQSGIMLDKDYLITGRNTLVPNWKEKYIKEIEPSEIFYPFSGVVANVGAGYCCGLMGGALAGTYTGLIQHQTSIKKEITWGTARQALWNQGLNSSVLYSNRIAAALFSVGFVESILRYFVISQAEEKIPV